MAESLAPPGVERRRLYLVRHGHVDYFDAGGRPLDPRRVPLSELGVRQARALGRALAGERIDRVVASDYPRAVQTATEMLGERPLAVEAEPAWREIRAGRLREIPAEYLMRELAYAYADAGKEGAAFLRGETFAEFERRILGALDALLQDARWRGLLLVSHDAVNRVLLCRAAACPLNAMASFEQDHACLNIVDVDQAQGRVVRCLIRAVNLTPYDPVKTGARLGVMEKVYASYVGSEPDVR